MFQDDLRELLRPELLDQAALDPLAPVGAMLGRIERYSPLSQLLAVNFESYLPDDLLVKTDRCTMANSLEARSPFLDTALVEYAATLPDTLKLRGGRTKAILRDAFADLLPAELQRRPKAGFGVPLDRWFRVELRSFVRDMLLAPTAASRDYLNRTAVQHLVEDHQAGRTNGGHRLWTLVCFERWLQMLPSWRALTASPAATAQ